MYCVSNIFSIYIFERNLYVKQVVFITASVQKAVRMALRPPEISEYLALCLEISFQFAIILDFVQLERPLHINNQLHDLWRFRMYFTI